MSDSKKMIYLGKAGKSFGPFDEKEVEALKRSGEYDNFSYIWDRTFRRWQPLHALPPEPVEPKVTEFRNGIQAICHDRIHLVSGSLDRVTDIGCSLLSREKKHRPYFAPDARVVLNLLDPSTGKSANLIGKLKGAQLTAQGWKYEIAWENAPEAPRVLESF